MSGRQMHSAVDLGHDGAAVASPPGRVEIPAPTRRLDPHRLAYRFGQARAPAESDEVDLAERISALRDVGHRR
ncbi:MAG: hypothetical protein QOD45_997 [Pseudonocardiales bacterium]|jgi:hypothetical protein|nr:hypothetical protein [Pseudonocardiales bacterium]